MSLVTETLKKATTKKNKIPPTDMVEVQVPDGLLTSHKKKYDAVRSAKTDLELSEEELLGQVVPQYVEKIKERYVNSARIVEGVVEATVSWKDAYSKIPIEKSSELKEIVGEEYDDYFKEVNEIVVKEEVASNPRLLEELVRAVGPDTFSKYFDVEQHIRPSKKFTEERHRTLSPRQNKELGRIGVRQHKPSVRVQ